MGKVNWGSGFASGMGRGRRKGPGVQGPIPGDEGSECVEKKKEAFPGFASWITSQCPRDSGCEQTPAQPAKQQRQPPGQAGLLRTQIRPGSLFSCFIFLGLEITIFIMKY